MPRRVRERVGNLFRQNNTGSVEPEPKLQWPQRPMAHTTKEKTSIVGQIIEYMGENKAKRIQFRVFAEEIGESSTE